VTALANDGLQIGRHQVRRLIQRAQLKPVWKRKFVHTTDSKHCPAGSGQRAGPAVQSGGAECGLRLRHQVYPN
jgi:hypothetical protein